MIDLELVLSDMERVFEQNMRSFNTHGIVVCITDREKLLRAFTYGCADMATEAILTPDTAFQIGSISISFSSVAALSMWDQGELDLQAPVNTYLPWLRLESPQDPIRLHHLMSHTAGLPLGSGRT
jgi:CubicO group peptidase (beta-lactamase class C family)